MTMLFHSTYVHFILCPHSSPLQQVLGSRHKAPIPSQVMSSPFQLSFKSNPSTSKPTDYHSNHKYAILRVLPYSSPSLSEDTGSVGACEFSGTCEHISAFILKGLQP